MRYIFTLILILLLSSCASLTGSRTCSCEYNEKTGDTKWECESGAISERASVEFGPRCEFKAGAEGAQQGRNVIDSAAFGEIIRQILTPGQPSTGVFGDEPQ